MANSYGILEKINPKIASVDFFMQERSKTPEVYVYLTMNMQ